MFIAHLPAGYILSVLSFQQLTPSGVDRNPYLRAGLFGAIAPDLDMIYFYGFDHHAHPHHSYFSHFPSIWLLTLALAVIWLRCANRKALPLLMTIFNANSMLHMLLDSLAGGIYWLAPFVMKPFSLVTVDRPHEPWWLNFLLHWSFLLELTIVVWAAWLWRQAKVE
jgi:hypothetical protein